MLTHWIIWLLLTGLLSCLLIFIHKNPIKRWLAIVYLLIWAVTSSITLSKWKVDHWINSMQKVFPSYAKTPKNKSDPTALSYPFLLYFMLRGKGFKPLRRSIRKLK